MGKFWKIVKQSTFLWTLLFVALANYAAGTVNPLSPVPHSQIPALQLSESALTFKFECLSNLPAAPEVTLLGSSLPMCAFYYSDGDKLVRQLEKITAPRGLNLMQSYPEAKYFRSQLKRQFAKDPTVFNFTTAACMPSDARLLLMRMIEKRRQPQVLIYGLGLRDFVDNVNPPPGQTPAFRALCDASYLAHNASVVTAAAARTELALASLSQVYRLKDQFHLLMESSLCREFKRQTNLERAFANIDREREQKKRALATSKASETAPATENGNIEPPNQPHKPNSINSAPLFAGTKAKPGRQQPALATPTLPTSPSTLSLLDYPARYNPPNYKQLAREMTELNKIVDVCQANGIKLVLVNMPVSAGHKTLSAPGLRQTYLANLQGLAAQHSIPIIDFENNHIFAEKDFLDTVHLSNDGAKKMIADLLKGLERCGIVSTLH